MFYIKRKFDLPKTESTWHYFEFMHLCTKLALRKILLLGLTYCYFIRYYEKVLQYQFLSVIDNYSRKQCTMSLLRFPVKLAWICYPYIDKFCEKVERKRCTRLEILHYEFICISNLYKYCQSLSPSLFTITTNHSPLGSALKSPWSFSFYEYLYTSPYKFQFIQEKKTSIGSLVLVFIY